MATKAKMVVEATEEAVEVKEPKFTIDRLRKHSVALFGVTTSTFDGAMYGHDEELTVKEAKAVIDEWLKK